MLSGTVTTSVHPPPWGDSPGYLDYLAKHVTFPKIYVGTIEAEIIATHENVDILDRKVLQKKGKVWQQIKKVIPYRIQFIFQLIITINVM